VPVLKNFLNIIGGLTLHDSSTVYNEPTIKAVKDFQSSFGFTQNGMITPATLKEMNVPVKERIKQILINLSRM
jgi:murein L,D-transpeptidase YcbB/YkuD